VSEEFQCLLDQIRAAATGATGDGESPPSSSGGGSGVSADDADIMLFEASLGKKKPRPVAPGTAGKEKKKTRLSLSDDEEGENAGLAGRPTRSSKRNVAAGSAQASRRPLRAKQTNVKGEMEMEVDYSDGEAEVSF
jgi:hypothetical protein